MSSEHKQVAQLLEDKHRVPTEGIYEEVFNSDDPKYGGSGVTNKGTLFDSIRDPIFGSYSEGIRLRVPPLGATILSLKQKRSAKKAPATAKKPTRKTAKKQ